VQRDEVEYSLRAIPLGGYVAFPDDDPKNSKFKPDDPDLLQNRSIPERGLVISAGVIANVIFALAVLFAQVCSRGIWGIGTVPNTESSRALAWRRPRAACQPVLTYSSRGQFQAGRRWL
jgi:membrane-associated protease RseP (regulator of RpoE activity)